MRRYRRRETLNIWPGFVDALAALLMAVIFVIMLFALGQFVLTDALGGRDRALAELNDHVAKLVSALSLEEEKAKELDILAARLRALIGEKEQQASDLDQALQTTQRQLTASTALADQQRRQLQELYVDIEAMRALRDELQAEAANLIRDLADQREQNSAQKEISDHALVQVEMLNRQLAALRNQMAQLSAALELAQGEIENRDQRLEELGKRLNLALAKKVQELAAFRSEFFGRLKQALGNHPDLRVVGDRFVFQSELLFASGSAQLGEKGKDQVVRLAESLQEIKAKIPPDIPWVLRIDGHTDIRPVRPGTYSSNWELSTARALAIVRFLVTQGVDPSRLMAAGFGPYHPLDRGETDAAFARNRRIEIKLTSY